MTTDYYSVSGNPVDLSLGLAAIVRAEFALIEAGFAKFPSFSGNASSLLAVNSGETAVEAVPPSTVLTSAGVTASVAELNYVDGVTSAIQTQLDSITAQLPTLTASQLVAVNSGGTAMEPVSGATALSNMGVTASVTELNYVDGVTANVQAQIDAINAIIGASSPLSPADGNFIVGSGSAFVVESGATARASLGLGDAATATLISSETDTVTEGEVYKVVDTSATFNCAFGWEALSSFTGESGCAFGNQAAKNATGNHATAFGDRALTSATTGANLTAVGSSALRSCTAGSGNCAFGTSALYFLTTGSGNCSFGDGAGSSITTSRDNCFFGNDAGSGTPGLSECCVFGADSDPADSAQNAVIIGYNITGVPSNSAVIGNGSITSTVLRGTVLKPFTRNTISDTGTVTVAQHRDGVIFQDASGGNVTCTTATGTALDAEFPLLQDNGQSIALYHASNHATNTSTISGGSGVTLVGSGAVTETGGQYLLIKTGAATYDLVRVG